jgi:hypothetical protein
MRELILRRIDAIKKTETSETFFGDRFETGKKTGYLKSGYWGKDQDFSLLSDAELLDVYNNNIIYRVTKFGLRYEGSE